MAQTTTTSTPTVGAVIRAWRLYRGLSTKALAKKAEVRGSYLSEIEHDKKKNPWLEYLEKLAVALEISLQDIQDRRMPHVPHFQQVSLSTEIKLEDAAQKQKTWQIFGGHQFEELKAEVTALKAEVAEIKEALTELNSSLREIAHSPIPQQVAEELHELLRLVREEQDYLSPPALLEDVAQVYPFIGHWEGYAWQELRKDTSVLLLSSFQNRLEVSHDMTAVIGARLKLESAGGAELSGEGGLRFDFRPLGVDLVKTVYIRITGAVLKAGRLTLELENLQDFGDRAHISGRLSEDGRLLRGAYRGFGSIVKKSGTGELSLEETSGEFSLEKVVNAHSTEEFIRGVRDVIDRVFVEEVKEKEEGTPG